MYFLGKRQLVSEDYHVTHPERRQGITFLLKGKIQINLCTNCWPIIIIICMVDDIPIMFFTAIKTFESFQYLRLKSSIKPNF